MTCELCTRNATTREATSNAATSNATTPQQQSERITHTMSDEEGVPSSSHANNNSDDGSSSVRFEDLTVDDDVPIIDRVVRYSRSSIALQRLVHVKMLAETAQLAGPVATQKVLIPCIRHLLTDAESVIRQHVAAQLLALAMTAMTIAVVEPNEDISTATVTVTATGTSLSATTFDAQHRTIQRYLENSPPPSSHSHSHSSQHQQPTPPRQYDEKGYKLVVTVILTEYLLNTLLQDAEVDVRRAAADAIAGLSLQLKLADVATHCLPVPVRMALQQQSSASSTSTSAPPAAAAAPPPNAKVKRSDEEQRCEELRIAGANLLAELGGAASEHSIQRQSAARVWVQSTVVPAILALAQDAASFRVRRCAAQALPRLLGAAGSVDAAIHTILPAFVQLSLDDVHRVRKATGECLVDLSRAMVILAAAESTTPTDRDRLFHERRTVLLPLAERLLQDSHKMVRQGMMQFLGPFIASFYPYQYSSLHTLLPTVTESDGSHHLGIVAPFFPHATSMVSRLNASSAAGGVNGGGTSFCPTPVHSSLEQLSPPRPTPAAQLNAALPTFVRAARVAAWSLQAVVAHREHYLVGNSSSNSSIGGSGKGDSKKDKESAAAAVAVAQQDVQAVVETLLDYFCALAAVNTGDDNTDAEMRVYCAYSFPAVVLLLGPEHWEGSLQTCFFTLLYPRYPNHRVPKGKENSNNNNGGGGHDVDQEEEEDDEDEEPPLPVKRCLASSLHTVAHVLGAAIAVRDIAHNPVGSGGGGGVLSSCFLNDTDDSVRLSTLRNFSSLVSLLPIAERRTLLLQWSDMVQSDDLLGCQGKKGSRSSTSTKKPRSATNPTVLNWRQRDYVSRSLPDLILLVDPGMVTDHLWPILQHLLQDSVDLVRDDALWAIPPLLQSLCADTLTKWGAFQPPNAKQFSTDTCSIITTWIKETILRSGSTSQLRNSSGSTSKNGGNHVANFKDRQLYCRICAAVGLALRFGDGNDPVLGVSSSRTSSATMDASRSNDPVTALSDKFKSFFLSSSSDSKTGQHSQTGPYQRLTAAEQKHMKRILIEDLLPAALAMKEDRISNVRITLMKGLRVMPVDVQELAAVKPVLKDLEEESETWTSFGEEDPPHVPQQEYLQTREHETAALASSGPIDVDNVAITPEVSRDDEEEDDDDENTDDGEDFQKDSSRKDAAIKSSNEDHSDSSDSAGPVPASKSTSKLPTQSPPAPPPVASLSEWKCVLFEAGSIGMQLEPTADDSGCRVCGFLDSSEEAPSPARASGKISIGDVIVSVNGTPVTSYDNTIAILKAGGRRKITFRPGCPGDESHDDSNNSDGGGNSADDSAEDTKRREKKSKSDKGKDKPKKEEKEKKVKKVKKDKDKEKEKEKKVKKEKKKTDP